MQTKVENSITTRFHSTSEKRASNQNLPLKEGTENQVHTHKALKPPCLCEKNARVGISSKDFNNPRIVLKNKQPSNIPKCAQCEKSSENHSKCRKSGIRKNKREDERNTSGTGAWVAPSNLKAAQTFILCTGSTQQSVKPIKGFGDNKPPNQQLELLRIFPKNGTHIEPVNKSSDVFSITEESFSTSIISKNSPQPYGLQCNIVNAPTAKLISTQRELHATVISGCNIRNEHQSESLVSLVAAGDSKLKTETFDSHSVNVLRRISTYSVMSSQGVHGQTSMHPMVQDIKLTISRVSAHLPEDLAKASPELIALSASNSSPTMVEMETSQLITSKQPNDMENVKNFELTNENVIVPAQDGADGTHIDKENLRSPSQFQQAFIKKNSSTETHISAVTRNKKYCRISEKEVSPLKEVTGNCQSAGHPSEKNLGPIRLSRANNTTVQSNSTLGRKNQSVKINSYDILPTCKPGGATKHLSTNITKSSELKENLPQNSVGGESNSNPLQQAKSSAGRQRALSCEATTEKSATHLFTTSLNANDTRMIKIYNCLADANLGRGCKPGTDKTVISRQKHSSSDIDNGSRSKSITDLLRGSGNVCPKSNKACDLRLGNFKSRPSETLFNSSSSTRLRHLSKCGKEDRGIKDGEKEPVTAALKRSTSKRQVVSVHADSANGDSPDHEASRNDQRRVHEPPFNISKPLQKSAKNPMKKSLPFVKQSKPKKSINTCTISLNILKQFFYRQGISAELIDRAEQDLRRRYGGDGRSIEHVNRLHEKLDCSDKLYQESLGRCGPRNTEIIQNKEDARAKKSMEGDAMQTLTHAEKPTKAGHSQPGEPRKSCTDLQPNLEQVTSSDSRKSVTAETQTLLSFTSLKHIGVGCDERSINVTAPVVVTRMDACNETVNLPTFSVSTNTEASDQQSSQSDTSVLNDHSSIKNENLLAERVFDSSSNVSIASSVSSCNCTKFVQNPPTILPPHVPVSGLSVSSPANTGNTTGRHECSMMPSLNDGIGNNKGHAQKSSWTLKKARKFALRKRRGHCTRYLCSKRTSKRNSHNSGIVSAKCANRSWAESDISHEARTPSIKRSLNSITLSEVTSLMELLLHRMDTANAGNSNSLHEIASLNSKAVLLKQATYDSQLINADKLASQTVTSFSVIARACLLSLVYGIVCLFVFSCLQFSITCDFSSSRRFS